MSFLIALISVALAQTEPSPDPSMKNANVVRSAKGVIGYKILSTGASLGEETWSLSVHPDGSRNMQAMNQYGSPGGQWRGSGLFSVHGDRLSAVANTPNGVITHEVAVPKNFSFVPHPLSTDAWQMAYYDKAKGGTQDISVYDMDAGAAGPQALLGRLYTQKPRFVGRESLTTPAGTFETERFKTDDAVDIYVTGPDAILVRFQWTPTDRLL